MWKIISHIPESLTNLIPIKTQFTWTDIEQKLFDKFKRFMDFNTILAYPNFNKQFDISTDTGNLQLGKVIIQEVKLTSL